MSREEDEPALLELHNSSFSGHAPRSMAHWRWKYRDNPLKRTEVVLVVDHDGSIAAAYGGLTHRVIVAGQDWLGGIHIDAAVAPRFVGRPTSTALMVAAGGDFFARFAGGKTRLNWGFPEPALHRMGLRHLDFEVLRDVAFLVNEAGTPRRPTPKSIVVERVDRFGDAADRLWARCRDELGTAIVRDQRYLDWRYADQPELEHILLVARDANTGDERGLAVAREGGWTEQLLSVLDWLVPRDDRDAEDALVARLHQEAFVRRRDYLGTWFSGVPLIFFRFQRDHGFFVQPTPYQECFRSLLPRANRRYLAEHWYQTMGDLDCL